MVALIMFWDTCSIESNMDLYTVRLWHLQRAFSHSVIILINFSLFAGHSF
jgi:hypothetical protein